MAIDPQYDFIKSYGFMVELELGHTDAEHVEGRLIFPKEAFQCFSSHIKNFSIEYNEGVEIVKLAINTAPALYDLFDYMLKHRFILHIQTTDSHQKNLHKEVIYIDKIISFKEERGYDANDFVSRDFILKVKKHEHIYN